MIRIKLGDEEKKKLGKYRGQASSINSEKVLMVLLSNEGKSPVKIAQSLKRHPHTTRRWLKEYQKMGEKGLERRYSPGRPNLVREEVKRQLQEILEEKCPLEFGYQDGLWTVALMIHYLKEQQGVKVSDDTVERALKEMGYTYRRPVKSVSKKAPSKKEKLAAVEKIVDEILELVSKKDCEIFALDESHFSNEPYLVRGWQKKRWPPEATLSSYKRTAHFIWLLESPDNQILLEKIERG